MAGQKTTKKRPAASQAGPAAKKIHLDKPAKAGKKRSQPVTLPVRVEASISESEEDPEEEKYEDEENEAAADEPSVDAPSTIKDPAGLIPSFSDDWLD